MGQLFFDVILHHTIITLIILCSYQKSWQKKVQALYQTCTYTSTLNRKCLLSFLKYTVS
jgi:hypothetical protein